MVTVHTHCDVTMGRWHCLGNQDTNTGDVAIDTKQSCHQELGFFTQDPGKPWSFTQDPGKPWSFTQDPGKPWSFTQDPGENMDISHQ